MFKALFSELVGIEFFAMFAIMQWLDVLGMGLREGGRNLFFMYRAVNFYQKKLVESHGP